MIYRCILPKWATEEYPDRRRVLEGEFDNERIEELNALYYNIYFLPNYPSLYDKGVTVEGSHIDTFRFVFCDMDLKDEVYADKESFLATILDSGIDPTYIVDSGNGIHVYWQVSDLDAMSFLRLQRRLMRRFKTDEAVGQIYQLMRVPGTVNTKHKDDFKLCERIYENEAVYTCEDLDKLLPPITPQDEEYCRVHYDKTYHITNETVKIDEKLPAKFGQLLRSNAEAKSLWCGQTDDRSKADYRLGHLMFASEFTRDEALSVLVNSAKALARAPVHRLGYATNIVDKIWTFEMEPKKSQDPAWSSTVREILQKKGSELKGTRFPCHRYLDATNHGFRLGQVIGLVAGVGVGKTAMALNMFEGFVRSNPEYDHFFVPLEQPAAEIADRWQTMCGGNTQLFDKVHVLSNYDDNGGFRHLSFQEIRDYILQFQEKSGRKIGCVVIDHIGVLKKKTQDGENQGIMDICHEMKSFAVQTNTMLVMQSQSNREKAGIGDLELDKDAAYGTMFFEAYCDYLITVWQPLKRCYSTEGCPTITSFKFCKIRHKKKGKDLIQEDVRYNMFFDTETERLRELTQDEETAFNFFQKQAANVRKKDRKIDIVPYTSVRWTEEGGTRGDTQSSQDPVTAKGA